MTDIRATFSQDIAIAVELADSAFAGSAGTLEDLVQAYVNAGLAGANAVQIYRMTFTDASFTLANLLIVPHNFARTAAAVRVLDASGVRIYPDETDSGINAVVLDFSLYRTFIGTGAVICV